LDERFGITNIATIIALQIVALLGFGICRNAVKIRLLTLAIAIVRITSWTVLHVHFLSAQSGDNNVNYV